MNVCNPNTWEAEARKTAMNLKPAWATQQASGQLVLQSWTLSQNIKKRKKKEEERKTKKIDILKEGTLVAFPHFQKAQRG